MQKNNERKPDAAPAQAAPQAEKPLDFVREIVA
jgi:hypothetical protein